MPTLPRVPVLKVRHLMKLVASGHSNPQAILEKAFQWEHERRMELAKWLMAIASGLLAAVAAATLSRGFRFRTGLLNLPVTYWFMGLAGLLAAFGIIVFIRAQVLHRRYVLVSGLLAQLQDIQPFLKRLAREEAL